MEVEWSTQELDHLRLPVELETAALVAPVSSGCV